MKFIPAPGTYIAEEIKEKSALVITEHTTQIKKGRVVAVGEDDITEFGVKIPVPVKVGDIAHFLSYQGDYDQEKIDGKLYFTILRKDHRFVTHED